MALPPKSTSMYVGKIAPGVDDPTIQALLEACGPIKSWNRLVVGLLLPNNADPVSNRCRVPAICRCSHRKHDALLLAQDLFHDHSYMATMRARIGCRSANIHTECRTQRHNSQRALALWSTRRLRASRAPCSTLITWHLMARSSCSSPTQQHRSEELAEQMPAAHRAYRCIVQAGTCKA